MTQILGFSKKNEEDEATLDPHFHVTVLDCQEPHRPTSCTSALTLILGYLQSLI